MLSCYKWTLDIDRCKPNVLINAKIYPHRTDGLLLKKVYYCNELSDALDYKRIHIQNIIIILKVFFSIYILWSFLIYSSKTDKIIGSFRLNFIKFLLFDHTYIHIIKLFLFWSYCWANVFNIYGTFVRMA